MKKQKQGCNWSPEFTSRNNNEFPLASRHAHGRWLAHIGQSPSLRHSGQGSKRLVRGAQVCIPRLDWQVQWLPSRVAPRDERLVSRHVSNESHVRLQDAASSFLVSVPRHKRFYCKGATSESLTVGSLHALCILRDLTAYWTLARLQIEQFRRDPVSPETR